MSNSAGLARSLTTRIHRKKSVAEHGSTISQSGIGRAFSMRKPERTPFRPEISLPIELLSATNPLAFNAPDINSQTNSGSSASPLQQLAASPSTSSLRSENSIPGLGSSSSLASPAVSGVSTPVNEVPEHEFQTLHNRLTSLPEVEDIVVSKAQNIQASDDCIVLNAPAIPKRAPSHTKRTHQALARQRSISRMRSSSSSTDASVPSLTGDNMSRKSSSSSIHHLSVQSTKDQPAVCRNSADMFSARTHMSTTGVIVSDHPFGAELAKLTEVAEEFNGSPVEEVEVTPAPLKSSMKKLPAEPTIWDEENEYLSKHGLRTYSAEEYMAEIGSPFTSNFSEEVQWL